MGLCSRYVQAMGRCIDVGVATSGSGTEDVCPGLESNPCRSTQNTEALRVPEESSEYCCIWRRYGTAVRD